GFAGAAHGHADIGPRHGLAVEVELCPNRDWLPYAPRFERTAQHEGEIEDRHARRVHCPTSPTSAGSIYGAPADPMTRIGERYRRAIGRRDGESAPGRGDEDNSIDPVFDREGGARRIQTPKTVDGDDGRDDVDELVAQHLRIQLVIVRLAAEQAPPARRAER